MGWFDWYLQLFDGEPAWLIVVVSIILLAGAAVILERLLKWGVWILIIGLVGVVAFAGIGLFLRYTAPEKKDEPPVREAPSLRMDLEPEERAPPQPEESAPIRPEESAPPQPRPEESPSPEPRPEESAPPQPRPPASPE